MGLRYRKSFKAGPLRLTASTRGLSASVGSGAGRITRRAGGGVQLSSHVPGTGLGYTTTVRGKAGGSRRPGGSGRGPTGSPPYGRVRTGTWYWVATLLTVGLAAPVALGHAFFRTRNPLFLKQAIVTAVVSGAYWSIASALPVGSDGQATGAAGTVSHLLEVALIVGSLVLVRLARRQAYGRQPVEPVEPDVPAAALVGDGLAEDPFVQAARRARERRVETRALVASDPLLAAELGVGRPHVTASYDDGGLLDLNAATEQQLADTLALSPETAAGLCANRTHFEGFSTLAEIPLCTTLSPHQQALLEEYGVLLPFTPGH